MANLKIFTTNVEAKALEQINTLIAQPSFSNCKVRIMPDVHAGAGCVIGFTANLGEKVIPNIVGVDIGCGMLTVNLGQIDIDYAKLDEVIRTYIPSGRNVHSVETYPVEKMEQLYCYKALKNKERVRCSLGTLGAGNHFIELDEDMGGNKYLVIHSGSRNLGKQVADYYQKVAIDNLYYRVNDLAQARKELIASLKAQGREREISGAIEELCNSYKAKTEDVPKELCYLEGEDRLNYLHDMKICQEFAVANRAMMADIICRHMHWTQVSSFETIHNYIEHDTNMVRKGAISAKEGELLLIPINMRDGCIIGIGKGNEDWNCSAPHGAGRLMSRRKARENVALEDFKASMEGIYTTSVNQSTLDESPMAYKSMDEILENIKDTVEVECIIKPIYNFKASE
jgi:RNA-splicing ligase RtcB